ncbi:hypothetical protein [Methanolacinia paynteri]|uniref:hypothetical protein n=1 Tax=Methanolacinia paynteri TaxID=230356 RepID=UPI00064F07A7|nr:hypothetical protein [Methanolacinia paynteri]
MSSTSWYRIASVQVDDLVFDYESCDIEFKIKKSGDSSQNQGEITLWNLDNKTLNAISKDARVRVKAGFKGDYGTIFEGYVTKKEPQADGVDLSTIITCSDSSFLFYNSKEFVFEVREGQNLSGAVKQVYDACDVPAGKISDIDYTFPHARTFTGTGQAILEEMLKTINGSSKDTKYVSYTEGGMGYFVRSDNRTAEVFEINSSTGLLTIEVSEDSNSDTVATLTTLLNWRIGIDTWLRIESPNINGLFKASGYTHTLRGDTYETEIEVAEA